jgi:hypothetical protein
MNRPIAPRRTANGRRRSRGGRAKTFDLWRVPGAPPAVEPITAADDPTALLRSLGAPPLLAGIDLSLDFGRVAAQSAQIATALALSVDLLASRSD